MAEIKCPKCATVFTPDESGLADIIKQVRDEQFENELKERDKLFLVAKEDAVKTATAETTSKLLEEQSNKDVLIAKLESELKSKNEASEKDKQLAVAEALRKVEQERDSLKTELDISEQAKALAISDVEKRLIKEKSEIEAEVTKLKIELQTNEEKSQTLLALELAKKDTEISELKSKEEAYDKDKQLAVTEAIRKVEQERDSFKSELDMSEQVKALAISDVEKRLIKEKSEIEAEIVKLKSDLQTSEEKSQNLLALEIAKKDTEISDLKSNFITQEAQLKQNSTNALTEIEKERDALANDLKSKENEIAFQLSQIKEQHQKEINLKNDEVAYYKDFKMKQSSKLLGETLEQHCQVSFNRLRSTAFKNAYFDKDNDASSGSKGDFIFKDYDDEGNEIVSIMFEMKNESDTTATKKKNDDFLDKLDKDRNQKGCEYAVLVSKLEQDDEYYNEGIVDKFYRYPKMYVIRPQFFIPMITVLRNAALSSLTYKTQLALARSQNIDITNFENDLFSFKTGFDKSVGYARDRYNDAVEGINNAIKQLEDIKEALRLSDKHLGTANNKLEDLTIKKLTKNNPTMITMFDEVNNRVN